MPYADPDKQREAKAESSRRRYSASKAVREAVSERRASWRAADPEKAAKSNQASQKAWRLANPEAYKAANRERMRKARARKKAEAAAKV